MSFTGDVIVTRQELTRKPASWKKDGTNFQGSQLPAKNTRRTSKEAGFLEKTWNELARKSASCKKHGTNFQGSWLSGKKHGTNLQGSQLPTKNTGRTSKEAGFLEKTWNELARKPASCKKHGTNFQGSG
jgi:hypothetical protein